LRIIIYYIADSKASESFKTPLDVTTLSKKEQANLAVIIVRDLIK